MVSERGEPKGSRVVIVYYRACDKKTIEHWDCDATGQHDESSAGSSDLELLAD